MKDSGCDHHSLPFMCGGCDIAFLNRCLNDYQAVSLWKWRREGALNPDTFMQHVITFERKHLTPLDLHPVQVLRIMLLDGYYHFGERWGRPVGANSTHDLTQQVTYATTIMPISDIMPASQRFFSHTNKLTPFACVH
jgi:hypothetical protein